jgi:hypothetical protein
MGLWAISYLFYFTKMTARWACIFNEGITEEKLTSNTKESVKL